MWIKSQTGSTFNSDHIYALEIDRGFIKGTTGSHPSEDNEPGFAVFARLAASDKGGQLSSRVTRDEAVKILDRIDEAINREVRFLDLRRLPVG